MCNKTCDKHNVMQQLHVVTHYNHVCYLYSKSWMIQASQQCLCHYCCRKAHALQCAMSCAHPLQLALPAMIVLRPTNSGQKDHCCSAQPQASDIRTWFLSGKVFRAVALRCDRAILQIVLLAKPLAFPASPSSVPLLQLPLLLYQLPWWPCSTKLAAV